jgi:hypothetical protein
MDHPEAVNLNEQKRGEDYNIDDEQQVILNSLTLSHVYESAGHYYRTRSRVSNLQSLPSEAIRSSTTGPETAGLDHAVGVDHAPHVEEDNQQQAVEVNGLFSFICAKSQNTLRHEGTLDDETAMFRSVSNQPATFAVQQFLARHPQKSSDAIDDLLRLIKYITSPDMLLSARQMPITFKTLSKATYESMQSTITEERDWANGTALSYLELQTRYGSCTGLDYSKVTGLRIATISITDGYAITLPYFDIIAVALDIVAQHRDELKEGKQALHFRSITSYEGEESILYNDISSGQWFKEVEDLIRPSKVLAIIPYLDGVNVDFFDSISMVPVVVTLGNLERKYRNQLSGKRLVAFLPNPSDEEIRLHLGNKEDLSACRHFIWNKCLEMQVNTSYKLVALNVYEIAVYSHL